MEGERTIVIKILNLAGSHSAPPCTFPFVPSVARNKSVGCCDCELVILLSPVLAVTLNKLIKTLECKVHPMCLLGSSKCAGQ